MPQMKIQSPAYAQTIRIYLFKCDVDDIKILCCTILAHTSISYFRRLFQSLKTIFILCGYTVTLTVNAWYQAQSLLVYGNTSDRMQPCGFCMN